VRRPTPAPRRPAWAPPLVIAITVLTSSIRRRWGSIGVPRPVIEQGRRPRVAGPGGRRGRRRGLAPGSGRLRAARGRPLSCFITPGIRPVHPPGASVRPKDDQARTMTPAEAVAAGANYIVVGRPIISAAGPAGRGREDRGGRGSLTAAGTPPVSAGAEGKGTRPRLTPYFAATMKCPLRFLGVAALAPRTEGATPRPGDDLDTVRGDAEARQIGLDCCAASRRARGLYSFVPRVSQCPSTSTFVDAHRFQPLRVLRE